MKVHKLIYTVTKTMASFDVTIYAVIMFRGLKVMNRCDNYICHGVVHIVCDPLSGNLAHAAFYEN